MRRIRCVLIGLTWMSAISVSAQEAAGPTVVLVHGAWGGGWGWKGVEQVLVERGATVFRPTLSGLGERHHLASEDIDLSTHISDVANLLEWEQLTDVILLGHSYGGMVITGVVERVAERVDRLVYLDAFLPFDGECVLSTPRAGQPCDSDEAGVLPIAVLRDGYFVPRWQAEFPQPPGDVPQPAATFSEPLNLESVPGRGKPALYVITRASSGSADDFDWAADRASDLGWPVEEVIGNHVVHRRKPGEIADLILGEGP